MEPPIIYLRSNVEEYTLPNRKGTRYLAMISERDVKDSINNEKNELEAEGLKLPSMYETPIKSGCRHELHLAPLLVKEQKNCYENFIGVLHWEVKL